MKFVVLKLGGGEDWQGEVIVNIIRNWAATWPFLQFVMSQLTSWSKFLRDETFADAQYATKNAKFNPVKIKAYTIE